MHEVVSPVSAQHPTPVPEEVAMHVVVIGQSMPHPPHEDDDRYVDSQPFNGLPSQSSPTPVQNGEHVPATHV